MKKNKLVLVIIPTLLIVIGVLAPRFMFRQTRISHELSRRVDFNIHLDISSKDVEIVDFRGRWSSMYAKLELSEELYDLVKQRFLIDAGTTSDKDYTKEVINEQFSYRYSAEFFLSSLSSLNRAKRNGGLQSMNLDGYKELFIVEAMYGKWFTTGGTSYVLVKENNGNCFLYLYSRV